MEWNGNGVMIVDMPIMIFHDDELESPPFFVVLIVLLLFCDVVVSFHDYICGYRVINWSNHASTLPLSTLASEQHNGGYKSRIILSIRKTMYK